MQSSWEPRLKHVRHHQTSENGIKLSPGCLPCPDALHGEGTHLVLTLALTLSTTWKKLFIAKVQRILQLFACGLENKVFFFLEWV